MLVSIKTQKEDFLRVERNHVLTADLEIYFPEPWAASRMGNLVCGMETLKFTTIMFGTEPGSGAPVVGHCSEVSEW